MRLPLAYQSYQTFSTRENSQSLVNMYAVQDTGGGKTDAALYPTPGLTLFANLDSVNGLKVIASIEAAGKAYLVYNTGTESKFGSLQTDGTWTLIGTVASGVSLPDKMSIAAIDDQVLIATGSTGYVYTISTNTLAAIVDIDFPANCTQVGSISGYFVAMFPSTNRFGISDLGNGLAWNALITGSANTTNAPGVAFAQLNQQLFVFTQKTTEIWGLVSNIVPLAPQVGYFINYGCVAPFSVAESDGSLIWLSKNSHGQGQVLKASSPNNPEVISTEALHYQFSTYTTLSDAVAYSYQVFGHEFYCLTFPTEGVTWEYDCSTRLWHERQSVDIDSIAQPAYTRHRGNCYVFLNGLHLVGDYTTSKVFKIDPTVYTDDANIIPRIIVTPDLSFDGQYISIYSLELFVEPGQGTNSGQGTLPLVGLEISRDGGFTFGNQRLAPAGPINQYLTRARWNQLGMARDFVFRFTVTDPIKFIALGASVLTDIEPEVPRNPLAPQ